MSLWFTVNAPNDKRKTYKRLLKVYKTDALLLQEAEVNALLLSCQAQFIHYIFVSIGKSANSQLFYHTLVLKMRGLSRSGMDFVSSLGATISRTTYDVYHAALMSRLLSSTKYFLLISL